MDFPIILRRFCEQGASDATEVCIDAEVVGLVINSFDGDFVRI
jgi:hypothetical protein